MYSDVEGLPSSVNIYYVKAQLLRRWCERVSIHSQYCTQETRPETTVTQRIRSFHLVAAVASKNTQKLHSGTAEVNS